MPTGCHRPPAFLPRCQRQAQLPERGLILPERDGVLQSGRMNTLFQPDVTEIDPSVFTDFLSLAPDGDGPRRPEAVLAGGQEVSPQRATEHLFQILAPSPGLFHEGLGRLQLPLPVRRPVEQRKHPSRPPQLVDELLLCRLGLAEGLTNILLGLPAPRRLSSC